MAMIVDVFVGRCLDVLQELATEKVVRILRVEEDLRRLQEKLEMIKAVLEEAERRRIQEPSVNIWLSKLKDVMYDADDIIDLCRIKGRQLQKPQREVSPPPSTSKSERHRRLPCFSSCFTTVTSVPFRHEIGEEIEKLNQRLEEISRDRTMFSLPQTSSSSAVATRVDRRQTSSLLTPDFVGAKVKRAADGLVESLLNSQGGCLLVFSIVGLGGIGKTTLAQKIYNHQKVQAHFAKRLWVCVSHNYLEIGLLEQIIRGAVGEREIHAKTKTELQLLVSSALAGNRFLLVLDDVWRADLWQDLLRTPLGHGVASGSRVLITTRNKNVARSMGAIQTYRVPKLSADDGWALPCKIVFEDGADDDIQDLHEIGMQIVEKCDGLPLAIKAIGGVLRTKDRNKSEWEKLHRSHAWSVTGELREEVRGALYLSYEDLPSQLKQCFLYCSLWPEDHELHQLGLCRLWVAEGFITVPENSLPEDIAEDYYDALTRRSLLHGESTEFHNMQCTIHDLIRSLALFLMGNESHFVDGNDPTNFPLPQRNSSRLRRLAIYHMKETETVLNAVENSDSEALRTLRVVECEKIKVHDHFQRFTHLRVLDLNYSEIENIPESIRHLQHLRLLDLGNTVISQLPESLECLVNLQFLNLCGCLQLCTLPESITRLCNLRYLNIYNTSLSYLPVGMGKLEHLTKLLGFVVGGDNNSLDELQSMSRLRILHLTKLKRASMGGIQTLFDKPYLKELTLEWKQNADRSFIPDGNEQIIEDLSPSPSLEVLHVYNFKGLNFPLWISMLPNLTTLILSYCLSCQHLPSLGQMPQLRILHIAIAAKVVTVGTELLGCDTEDGHGHKRTPIAFPKLETLIIEYMNNWEEWVCDAKEVDGGTRKTIKLLPCLQYLKILGCSKLRALPDGLQHATALKCCEIRGADSLREIKNIPSLEKLNVSTNRCLERISNLPVL